MNSACLSTNLSISHGQATLSTRGCSRVIHFIVVLPKTPAAAIGSIAEVTQDFLIYVIGALLAAVIVAAVLFLRFPRVPPPGRFGDAPDAPFRRMVPLARGLPVDQRVKPLFRKSA